MKTKEEYIAKQIEIFEKLKKSQQVMIDYLDDRIKKSKNLSDEEYEKIIEKEKLEDEAFAEEDAKLLSKLDELGISLEEFDNMTMKEIDERFSKNDKNGI